MNRATIDRDWRGGNCGSPVEHDTGGCTSVNILNNSDEVGGVAEVTHDGKQLGMVMVLKALVKSTYMA